MRYGPDWRPPWRETEQAACVSSDCLMRHPRMAIKSTMIRSRDGLVCVTCARRMGLKNDVAPADPEQLALDLPAP